MSVSVSIIICTHNRVEELRQTLAAIAQIQVPNELATELIVVDNASTDATKYVVESYVLPSIPIIYVRECTKGLSHARNTGIAAARGDIILFTDDDVRPPCNWIEGMCKPIRCGEAHAVAGSVRIAPHLTREWMLPLHNGWLAAIEYTSERQPCMVGANMAFAKTVLEEVTAFDPQLGAGASGFSEDTLFSEQLKVAGYTIVASPISVEHHFQEARLSRQSFLDAAVMRGKTGAYFAYHWLHNQVTMPLLREWKHIAELMWQRAIRWREWHGEEGAPVWELELCYEIHFFREYRKESKTPRNYKKHGLVKRHSVLRSASCLLS